MATTTADKSETKELIGLKPSDGETIYCELSVAYCSKLIRHMCEYSGDTLRTDKLDEDIVLPNVSGVILKKVIEWATHHKDDPQLTPDEEEARRNRRDDVSPWHSQFLKVDQETLFELILASKYLDIPGLLDLTCNLVASMIKGKAPDEIRKTFNIKSDFTPVEEE